ncbi:MAG: hypothetical protein E5W43_02025 [Mesorhizobium sp.]|nr:MAG: hypothetical protein E5W43_02025 [Mesorhizobium sp.]
MRSPDIRDARRGQDQQFASRIEPSKRFQRRMKCEQRIKLHTERVVGGAKFSRPASSPPEIRITMGRQRGQRIKSAPKVDDQQPRVDVAGKNRRSKACAGSKKRGKTQTLEGRAARQLHFG